MDFSPYNGNAGLQFLNARADNTCIDCTGVPVPDCPVCPAGQTCVQNIQTCSTCVTTSCISVTNPGAGAASSPTPSAAASKGPNAGAIAGGVIGGVVAIAALVYLTWRFCIKNKRQQYEGEDWVEFEHEPTDAEKDFSFRRDQRASTHTVGSMASTVLTRASNIIQIAYIPGMSHRSTNSQPGLLVPPVPPIPLALGPQKSPTYTDEVFFRPGDLRDSTYSNMTAGSDRTSYARQSVASTIYGKGAIVSPVTPQMIVRGKAAVVSVKTPGAGTPTGTLTPPVPSIDFDRYGDKGPPSPAFSVGSTFISSTAQTAAQPAPTRGQVVRLVSTGNTSSTSPSNDRDVEAGRSFLRDSNASGVSTIIDDTPVVEQGPFSDQAAVHSPTGSPVSTRHNTLSAVIDEAEKKSVKSGSGKRETTPFGDEHETRD